MNELSILENYEVIEKKGRAITTSRNVAEIFGKRHDDVLKAIRKLECSSEFRLGNFAESSYKNEQNKTQPQYLMTRDGFTILAMGFTGKEAMKFKEGYIKQFNAMERILQQRATDEWQESRRVGKTYQIELNDTIKDFVEYAKSQGSSKAQMYYKHFASFSNKSVDIKDGERDNAKPRQLMNQTYVIETIKSTIMQEMAKKTHYKDIYKLCQFKVDGLLSYIAPKQIGA